MPESLDDRILAHSQGLPENQREEMRAHLTYLREAWRGGNHYADMAEALEVIEENAAALRALLGG